MTTVEEDEEEFKIHISRVPTKFDEAIVHRILAEQLKDPDGGSDENDNSAAKDHGDEESPISAAIQVELIYPRDNEDDEHDDDVDGGDDEAKDGPTRKKKVDKGFQAADDDDNNDKSRDKGNDAASPAADNTSKKEHRGFGFVTFSSQGMYEKALDMSTIKGGRKPSSTKLYTMHLRPYTNHPDEVNQCYLWAKGRCPYGDNCKFTHVGPGACLPANASSSAGTAGDADNATDKKRRKRGKCFAYKKGKCTKGDDCLFSHDFEPTLVSSSSSSPSLSTKDKKKDNNDATPKSSNAEKDCINWKTKGKCRKGDQCPYRHDPELLKKLQAKKNNKRKRDETTTSGSDEKKKEKQPLCIRVFGMAYDTTEDDIRGFFQDCGKIQKVVFPTFDDSGRSKGYCGIWFASPKAVMQAVEWKNGQELLGRWLSVQAGKMYLQEWEANHHQQQQQQQQHQQHQ